MFFDIATEGYDHVIIIRAVQVDEAGQITRPAFTAKD